MNPKSSLWRIMLTAINVVGLRAGGAAIGLATQIALARFLSQSDVGVVFLAMSATSVLGLVATLGYPSLTLTSAARYLALRRSKLLDRFKSLLVRDTILISLVLLAAVAIAVAILPLGPEFRTALVFAALSLFAANLLRLNSALANSHRRFILSYLPDFVLRPGVLLLFVIASWLLRWPIGTTGILWAFTIVNTIVALGQAWVLGREGLQPRWQAVSRRLAAPLRGRALALVVVFAVASAFGDLVTIIGGMFLPPQDVAVLGVAIRLATLAGFVTQALQQIVLPDLAQVLVRNDTTEIHRLLLRVNMLSLVAVAVLTVAAAIAGPWLLKLFGPDYVSGHWPLVVLMLSQMLRAASGLNQHLLSIAGFQVRTAGACLFVLALLLAASSVLAPIYGIMGIALAVLLADAAWAFLLGFQAGRYTGHRGDILGLVQARP